MLNFTEKTAAIDIGSNSVLLTILAFDRSGRFKIIHEEIKTPRIGKDLTKSKIITQKSVLKLLKVLIKFKAKCERNNAKKILCAGTEALRRASNQKKIVQLVQKKTDLKIQVLSPFKEARLSFIGATEELCKPLKRKALVIDIGAGSTEQVGLTSHRKIIAKSIQLGALTLKEMFKINYPVTPKQLLEIQKLIREKLSSKLLPGNWKSFIGVGGTITTIPSLMLKMKSYNREKVDFYSISKAKILRIIQTISKKSLSELQKMKGIPQGRSDIFLPGLLILYELLKAQGAHSLLVRNRGLRFGLLFNYFKNRYPNLRLKL